MTDIEQPIASTVELVIECMKTKIARAIIARLDGVAWLRYRSFDRVKLLASDFGEAEIPAIQLIDVGLEATHEGVRSLNTWEVALELLLRPSEREGISQQKLWNKLYEIKRKLWAVPNFGIAGVIQAVYLGENVDLHTLDPFYFARLRFQVVYYEGLVRDC